MVRVSVPACFIIGDDNLGANLSNELDDMAGSFIFVSVDESIRMIVGRVTGVARVPIVVLVERAAQDGIGSV